MAGEDELSYLKSLVAQLNSKIQSLEDKLKAEKPKAPARSLRTILVGPPGAGNVRPHASYAPR